MPISLEWKRALVYEKRKPYFIRILSTIKKERESGIVIYPSQKDVFNAFRFTELGDIKIVIIGQDPYHRPGQADGLAFSVRPGVKLPPSLLNIYKELKSSIPNFTLPTHGSLESWAHQGVMLLNSILTVRDGLPRSHANLGWEIFTDKIVRIINEKREGVVFFLWGLHAKKKGEIIDKERHYVLNAPHPSPLSAHHGFFGSNHFVLANQWLEKKGEKTINWTLDQHNQ